MRPVGAEVSAGVRASIVAQSPTNNGGAKGRRNVEFDATRPMEEKPERVSETTKPDGEADPTDQRWGWVEPAVWTDRMLDALHRGVQGGKWHSLIDKVAGKENLRSSWEKVSDNEGAPGVDQVTLQEYAQHLDSNIERLSRQILEGDYQPEPVRRCWIDKPGGGERPLGIPTVKDRVVQTAIRHTIEPIFEREFAERSYGFRPGRGCKDALREVDELLEEGYTWVVDADIKSYFDTIPHEKLMDRVREKVSDGTLLSLIESYLDNEIMEESSEWTPQEGTPQGGPLSPLLANIYLDPLDQLMEQEGYRMVRYADDFVVLCESQQQARQAKQLIEGWVEEAGLRLHPEKTKLADAVDEGFDFLGYRFEGGKRFPKKGSMKGFRDNVRVRTRKNDGRSMKMIISDLNRYLEGWFNYFKHSYHTWLEALDGFVRRRLRGILRRRAGISGHPNGTDHHRWPNDFFEEKGLFSLREALLGYIQSLRGG